MGQGSSRFNDLNVIRLFDVADDVELVGIPALWTFDETLAERRRNGLDRPNGIAAGLATADHFRIQVGRENARIPAPEVGDRIENRHRHAVGLFAR